MALGAIALNVLEILMKKTIVLAVFACIGMLAATHDVSGQEPNPTAAELLGGPCQEVDRETGRAVSSRRRDALERRDNAATIAVTKAWIRVECGIAFGWFVLAELYSEQEMDADAVAVLTYLYDRQNNDLERRLNDEESALFRLPLSTTFLGSALSGRLRRDREQLQRRRAEGQSALSALSDDERPLGTRVVGSAQRGASVEGLTGEVHLTPTPILVRFPVRLPGQSELRVPAREVVFILDYHGEGYGNIWWNGQILQAPVARGVADHCPFPTRRCWAEYLFPGQAANQRGTWWVQVRTPDGVIGWTSESGNFGNMDACGT